MGLLESLTSFKGIVAKMLAVWALCGFTWAGTINATPLILKDIVGPVEAAEWQGRLTAVTATAGMILCPSVGYLSDKYGRVGILRLWLIAFSVSIFLVFFADLHQHIYPLIVSRMVPLSAASTVIFALTSDVSQGSEVLTIHGFLGGFFGTAALIGAGGVGIIARLYSRRAALAGVALVSAVTPLIATSMHKDKVPLPAKSSHTSYFKAAKFIATQDPLLRSLIIAFALLRVGNVNSMLMFTLYSNYRFNWDMFDVASMLGVAGALGVVWQLVGVKYIVDRYDNVVPFLIGTLALLPIATAGKGLATQGWHLWVCGLLTSVGGVTASIFNTKITVLASDDGLSGTALGLVGTLQNGMEIVLSIFFGNLLAWVFEVYPKSSTMLGLPYFINAFTYVLCIGFVLYGHIRFGHTHATWLSHTDTNTVEKGLSPNSLAPHSAVSAEHGGLLTEGSPLFGNDVNLRKMRESPA